MKRPCKRCCKCVGCCTIVVVILAVLAQWIPTLLWGAFQKWRDAEMAKGNTCLSEQVTTVSQIKDFEPLSWEESHQKASALLAQMTAEEKYNMMQGRGWVINDPKKWWYTGNIPPIPRLGIPSLNMQDAAGGFRTMWSELVSTVTCWPSALAMAATWDPEMVRAFSGAMADEFAAKGVNMILGPSVQVHRVARNGRNFEYIAGEDPYLGSRLAEAYVQGVNSRGLLTSVKHWGFNEQETNRNWEDSIVDDKTAWELYYPPFQAAIDAGATAVMCGYNRVDGDFSCSSRKQLDIVLRDRMGFRGFVQSDWWATHGTTVGAGLDQEMPGNHLDFGMSFEKIRDILVRNRSIFFAPETLAQVPQKFVDTAATRILAAMYRMGWIGKTTCTPPCCELLFRANATSDQHAELAREAATASVVLLKNENSILPISPTSVKSIAVVGSAAVGRAYDPAGSSQTFDGATSSWNTGDYYAGGGSGHVTAGYVVTPLEGIQRRAASAGIRVLASATEDLDSALKVAQQADITIVVGATTAGEAVDRNDLNLDKGVNGVIEAVSKAAKKTIVLMQTPGAVLMPWRDSVAASALMFLGGQETGSAWASILFGDVAPSGRLPIMIPASGADTIEPGYGERVLYEEGVRTSYRNPSFKAAYPFGHGLTYSTFDYGELAQCAPRAGAVLCVEIDVRNAGQNSAGTVVQLYMEFPAEAGYATPILKGFQKTRPLEPGTSAHIIFHLSERDLSYYNAKASSWEMASSAVAHVGESVGDLRAKIPLQTGR